MLDWLLIFTLGFLGSFGHCVGMCGPLTVVFAMSQEQNHQKPDHQKQPSEEHSALPTWKQRLYFHGLLNLGRVLSYALVGAAIGAVGSALVAGGQLAGIDSLLRRGLAIFTGSLLIWIGLSHIAPGWLPQLPFLHPLLQGKLHQRLGSLMTTLSLKFRWWTPALLGMVWGLIPCGFLYAAQIKAAETGDLWRGTATMVAFGLGTMPAMLGVGMASGAMSQDRRGQLFRLGGWVTLAIGILTLLRTDEMVDYTGHAALFCLMLALIARPISRFWVQPLRYRRALGVGAFMLAIAHTLHMLDHTLSWNLEALSFMLPLHQAALWFGAVALFCLLPAALTSTDGMVQRLGKGWRYLHLLAVPALLLAALHAALIGSSYLGNLEWNATQRLRVLLLGGTVLLVLLVRSRPVWALLSVEKYYAAPVPPK